MRDHFMVSLDIRIKDWKCYYFWSLSSTQLWGLRYGSENPIGILPLLSQLIPFTLTN